MEFMIFPKFSQVIHKMNFIYNAEYSCANVDYARMSVS